MRIQPFTFQFCTAFRERKQLADKTNEIIEVLNSADLENLPTEIERIDQNIANLNTYVSEVDANLTHRIDQIEEQISEDWILCPSDYQIYDYSTKKINHDTKIVYSLNFDYKLTFADNVTKKPVMGTIYLKKNDIMDLQKPLFSYFDSSYSDADNYNLIFGDMKINLSTISYGLSHAPYNFNVHGVCIDPINTTMDHRMNSLMINYQTDNMEISNLNPFINIYYQSD